MHVSLFACAESAVVDQRTNRLSLFHIMEEISSPTFPAAVPQLTVVVVMSREESEPSLANLMLRVTLTGLDKPLVEGPMAIDFQGRLRTRGLGHIAGMPVLGPGLLRFSLHDGDKELAYWEVIVIQVSQPKFVTEPSAPEK